MTNRILVVDDEKDMTRLLKRIIEPELKCDVIMAFSGEMALNILENQCFDLMICDIRMAKMDGFELLERVQNIYPDMTVMMITAFASIEIAVNAMKKGAVDFITKPFDQDEIIYRIKKTLKQATALKNALRHDREPGTTFGKLVGESEAMQEVYDRIQMFAESDVTVLITGESGTGKDLTAQSIHNLSQRANQPFIAVNCPTVPEQLLESELFGYKKGAFTNATCNRKGLFQEAEKGSIFLDEIGDIGPTIQSKLLRVFQEKEIKPLGEAKPVKVDVRIIASTNINLQKKISSGEFREDFFYRLNVLSIELPSLSQRASDIPGIAEHLVAKHCRKLNKPHKRIAPALMTRLQEYAWPGNVRELENVLIQGIIYAKTDQITSSDITLTSEKGTLLTSMVNKTDLSNVAYKKAKENILSSFNHKYIGALLAITNGNVTHAAKRCGLERQALQQIMKRFNITADVFRCS
jgi:DNA-binding NtrC family response regulator